MDLTKDIRDCRYYATLLCAARIIIQRTPEMNIDPVRVAARFVYDTADPAIWPALDSIKRVMEIDETIDNPLDALLRAGVPMINQEEPS